MDKFLCLALGSFWAAISSAAFGQTCQPNDFKDFKYRDMRSMTQYSFFSSMTKSEFDSSTTKFKSEMVIPYINVPASGDFQKMKAQLSQVARVSKIDQSEYHSDTMLDIGWSENGRASYRDCLLSQSDNAVEIRAYPGTDPFASDIVVSVRWRHAEAAPPTPVSSVICLNCDIVNGIAVGDKVEQGRETIVQIRRHQNEGMNFLVGLNGKVGQFQLPKPPIPLVVVNRGFTIGVSATTPDPGHGQSHVPIRELCLPKISGPYEVTTADGKPFQLKPNEEFVIGSATTGQVSYGGYAGTSPPATLTVDTPDRVCWVLDFDSYSHLNGRSGVFNVTVKTVAPLQ